MFRGLSPNPLNPRVIYSSGTDRRPTGGRLNTITIIFGLDWPNDAAGPADDEASLPQSAATASIFRVKDFLERRLLAQIRLLDIHAGCITVRYLLPDEVKPWSVQSAIAALNDVRDSFCVLDAKANVAGRAIKN